MSDLDAKRKTEKLAYTIVLGNEKGGSGKTTTSMHLIVALMRAGFQVASFDLDGRQRTLTRYLDNRRRWIEEHGHDLCVPDHRTLTVSQLDSAAAAAADEQARFEEALSAARQKADFIVIDCPGSDANLSRLAHEQANTLITPLNDSFADMDVIVEVGAQSHELIEAGVYSKMIMEQRQKRIAAKRKAGFDWILMRNRVSSLNSRNNQHMGAILDKLSKALGCRVAKGVSERVIFRELFLQGLTVLDLQDPGLGFEMSMSHVAARQEMRQLLEALWLPHLDRRLDRI